MKTKEQIEELLLKLKNCTCVLGTSEDDHEIEKKFKSGIKALEWVIDENN